MCNALLMTSSVFSSLLPFLFLFFFSSLAQFPSLIISTICQCVSPIKDFTAEEFENLWKGIELMESSIEGQIIEVHKITHTYRNQHGICAYNIDGVGWTEKEGCISFAKEGKLDVVLCSSHNGNLYLRSRPNSSIQESLQLLITKKIIK